MDSRMSEVTFCCCCWNCNENNVHIHSQKKRYKSCLWGCTFSKGTLLYPKATYCYLS